MKTRQFRISPDCYFEVVEYDNYQNDVTLEYVEHSSDHWYSDNNTSITLHKDTIDNLLDFLSQAFDKEIK